MPDQTTQFATVTFAMYDESPIACQGDDDHRRIRVVRNQLEAGADIQAQAQRRSAELTTLHGLFVQVWDVELNAAKPS